jgi:hypothetical protein
MHARNRRGGAFRRLRCLGAAAVLAGCMVQPRAPMPRPISAAPPDAAPLVEPRRESAYTPVGGGQDLLGRTVYRSEGGGPVVVEARDLLLGPGRRTAEVRLEGAAVMEVRQGRGVLSVDGRAQPLATGATGSVDQGQPFTLTNDGPAPLIIRVYVLVSR